MTDQPEPPGVLGNLPATRPQRRSAKRDRPARTAKARQATAAASAPAAARKPRAASAGPRKPAAPRNAAKPRSAAPTPPPGRPAADRTPVEPPSGADLLVTAVQAAGELAQIGLTLGEQLVKSAVRRLPRP